MAETIRRQPTGIPPRKGRGAPKGNHNAARPVRALSTRLKDLKRRVRAAIRLADALAKGG